MRLQENVSGKDISLAGGKGANLEEMNQGRLRLL